MASINLRLQTTKQSRPARNVTRGSVRRDGRTLEPNPTQELLSPVAYIGWNSDLMITHWCGAAERMFGLTVDDAVGKVQIVSLPFRTESRERFAQSLSKLTVGPAAATLELFTASGEVRYSDWFISPHVTADGIVDGATSTVLDVTGRENGRRALHDSEARYKHVVEQVHEVIYQTDLLGRWTFLNPAWTLITGYSVEDSIGRCFLEVVEPEDLEKTERIFMDALKEQEFEEQYEVRIRTKTGEPRTVHVRARRLNDGFIGTFCDVTERKLSEEKLADQYAFLRAIIDADPSLIFVKDDNDRFTLANKATADFLGMPVDDVIGKRASELIPHEYLIDMSMIADGAVTDVKASDSFSRQRWMQMVKTSIRSTPGAILGIATDVTDRKRLEQELAHQALHDTLTALPNRTLFMDRLARALAAMQRSNRLNAVILLDVDNFKVINDAMGHGAGDRLLIDLAERLQKCVRPGDTVARFGGDEFAVLLEEIVAEDDAVVVASRILDSLRQTLYLSGREVSPSVSIGIAIGRTKDDTPEELVRSADTIHK